MDINDLVARYPRLYHMAEADSWQSIRRHGLLSSNEVARRSGLTGTALTSLRRGHRAQKISVPVPGIGTIVLRDQKPMEAPRLQRALNDGTTPPEWYELINDRVFFWVDERRLLRLLGAREYRTLEHDVLTIDTASLLEAHAARVRLSHMNSGNTFPIPHYRGRATFCNIGEYPTKPNGAPSKEVVELTVLGLVPEIAQHVIEIRRMLGARVLRQIAQN